MKRVSRAILTLCVYLKRKQQLINSAKRGAILHATRNIRESGGHIEHELRHLLSRLLPKQFSVLQGYFFDTESNCTPQIDAMIVNSAESHELMRSMEGSSYVPITSALAVFEVKNSAYSVQQNFDQIAKRIASITEMRDSVLKAVLSAPGKASSPRLNIPPLLSVMLVATSENCKLTDVQQWYSSNHVQPTYAVFLDKGILITRRSALHNHFDNLGTQLGNDDHEYPGDIYLCAPATRDKFARGRLWLWIYFSLIDYLHKSDGKNPGILAFTKRAVDRYKLTTVISLADAADWDGSRTPFVAVADTGGQDPF